LNIEHPTSNIEVEEIEESASHLFSNGRAMRPRSADSFRKRLTATSFAEATEGQEAAKVAKERGGRA
jgi:hypothetical protein